MTAFNSHTRMKRPQIRVTLILTKLILLMSLATLEVICYKCDILKSELIVTEQTKPGTAKYFLEITDKPEEYVPEERYEVIIKGDRFVYMNPKFKKFIITLEPKSNADDDGNVTPQTGKFELGPDGLSRFSDKCKDTVVEANTQPKSQVSLIWKAPPSNSGCISMKVVVIESREKWYETDEFLYNGPLTKTLCENLNENEDVLPDVEPACCACDEAKYELAFEGKWVRNMHPKGFPEDIWTTRFSHIIGASHKLNHEFWKEDSEPSEGMQELAFNGSTEKLESELLANIVNLRTIIKARGVAYPEITSSSYAIFKVNNENHLVTLAAKMIPSPDWIVGLSNMELCLSNCSWRQSRSVNLYPWDVGIDDALEYTKTEPSNNAEPVITRITSSNPDDAKSPFYDPDGKSMNPIATVHFKLQKVIKKECDPNRMPPEEGNGGEGADTGGLGTEDEAPVYHVPSGKSGCETTGWSKWSSCSVQCGKGHMTRNVRFKHNPGPNDCLQIKKEETHECEAACQSGEEEIRICANIIWGAWSSCSVTCGKGSKQRYRVPSETEDDDEADRECPNKEEVECYEADC